jgi:hypothetical protein
MLFNHSDGVFIEGNFAHRAYTAYRYLYNRGLWWDSILFIKYSRLEERNAKGMLP